MNDKLLNSLTIYFVLSVLIGLIGTTVYLCITEPGFLEFMAVVISGLLLFGMWVWSLYKIEGPK